MLKVSIIGASGYAGGELLRLLLGHPQVEVFQVTSESHMGEFVYQQHPNLRKRTTLKFVSQQVLQPCDVLFLALPHGETQSKIEHYAAIAPRLIDLSADFRLKDPATYREYYDHEHAAPAWMGRFIYGLPELHRDEMRSSGSTGYISGVGCNATSAILSILPLARAGVLREGTPVIFDIKVGSSEGGASANPGSHHPERSGVVRTYAPTGHRHTAEVIQELGLDAHLTITSVDMVRGSLAAAHAFVKPGVVEKDLWRLYRDFAEQEPFIRLVKDRRGIYRVPDPKLLAGTNYVDVGFELDAARGRVVCLAAIDNLVKGSSGSAVQSMNLLCGFPETAGLEFSGLHPV